MKTLDEMLERWFVMEPGLWENDLAYTVLVTWWAVGNEDDGIIAYFQNQVDAFRFRLTEINRELNGGHQELIAVAAGITAGIVALDRDNGANVTGPVWRDMVGRLAAQAREVIKKFR